MTGPLIPTGLCCAVAQKKEKVQPLIYGTEIALRGNQGNRVSTSPHSDYEIQVSH